MITRYFPSPLFICFYFILFFSPGSSQQKRLSQRYCSSLLKRILGRNQIKMLFISHLRRFGTGFHKDTHKQTQIQTQTQHTQALGASTHTIICCVVMQTVPKDKCCSQIAAEEGRPPLLMHII